MLPISLGLLAIRATSYCCSEVQIGSLVPLLALNPEGVGIMVAPLSSGQRVRTLEP